MAEQIVFDITPDGITVETKGFKGPACVNEMDAYREFMRKEYGIEITVTDMKKKPEYFVSNSATGQKNKGGI